MNEQTIRETIVRILEGKKITLTRFAAEAGVEQASLWRFMNGKTGLSGTNLLKVLHAIEDAGNAVENA